MDIAMICPLIAPSPEEDSISLTETANAEKMLDKFSSRADADNSCPNAPDENPTGISTIDETRLTGVKRPRMTLDEQKPLVRVIYNSLTRESKRKLEELLQSWIKWDAQHCSLIRPLQDQNQILESGEDIYYPALHVGLDKPSSVSFWMENQTRNQQNTDLLLMDCDSAPQYDREYPLGLTIIDGSNNQEGGMNLIGASRCFNCDSYNHSLKECPKPRNNAAVNNARKQQKARHNQNSGNRNPTRYYQNFSGGKYEGLRPGALDSETRQLLGLGELDPPPWLNRMRELGYPPGYLVENEDEPSGITIFGDVEDIFKVEQEDGEILDTDNPNPQKKTSIEFPGVNAPIPANADERRWAVTTSSSVPHGNRPQRRSNHSSSSLSDHRIKEQYPEQRWSYEKRWSDEFRDNESSYHYSSRDSNETSRRSSNDRGRRSTLDREDSPCRDERKRSSGSSSHQYHDRR